MSTPAVRLFDLPAVQRAPRTAAHMYQALGVSAQMLLTARLLERDHKVAVPVTDDDGVDLIVNYTTLVQVKSGASRDHRGRLILALSTRRASERTSGSQSRQHIREHIDIIAVYGRDTQQWWFLTRDDLPAVGNLTIAPVGEPSLEAWHVFDQAGGV